MTYFPLGKSFAQLAKTYVGLVANELQHLDIERHFYVIFIIAQAKKPLNQKELAALVYADKPNLVRILDFLEEHNYVKRVANQNDKREQFIILTQKGAENALEIEAAYKKVDALFLTGLSADAQNNLLITLDTMAETTASEAKHHVTLKFKTHKN